MIDPQSSLAPVTPLAPTETLVTSGQYAPPWQPFPHTRIRKFVLDASPVFVELKEYGIFALLVPTHAALATEAKARARHKAPKSLRAKYIP